MEFRRDLPAKVLLAILFRSLIGISVFLWIFIEFLGDFPYMGYFIGFIVFLIITEAIGRVFIRDKYIIENGILYVKYFIPTGNFSINLKDIKNIEIAGGFEAFKRKTFVTSGKSFRYMGTGSDISDIAYDEAVILEAEMPPDLKQNGLAGMLVGFYKKFIGGTRYFVIIYPENQEEFQAKIRSYGKKIAS
ncbi:hypothetical protein JXA56_02770 [Candidatus Micrarchaeota archaeon]|nr:hypothetical protein [Candidatus Micrarchaeota archaeon]